MSHAERFRVIESDIISITCGIVSQCLPVLILTLAFFFDFFSRGDARVGKKRQIGAQPEQAELIRCFLVKQGASQHVLDAFAVLVEANRLLVEAMDSNKKLRSLYL